VLCQVEASFANTQELGGEPHFSCFGRRHRKNKESSSAIWFEGIYFTLSTTAVWSSKTSAPAAKILCGLKNCVYDLTRISAGILCYNVFHPAPAKRFILRVAGINNAIAKKDKISPG